MRAYLPEGEPTPKGAYPRLFLGTAYLLQSGPIRCQGSALIPLELFHNGCPCEESKKNGNGDATVATTVAAKEDSAGTESHTFRVVSFVSCPNDCTPRLPPPFLCYMYSLSNLSAHNKTPHPRTLQ